MGAYILVYHMGSWREKHHVPAAWVNRKFIVFLQMFGNRNVIVGVLIIDTRFCGAHWWHTQNTGD